MFYRFFLFLFFTCLLTLKLSAGEFVFGLCISNSQDPFISELSNSIQLEAERRNVRLILCDAQQDAVLQNQQIEDLLIRGIDGLIVLPVSPTDISSSVLLSYDMGTPLITLIQRAINQDLASCFIGVNQKSSGFLEMSEAIKSIKGSGNIVILQGSASSIQSDLTYGYNEILKTYPNIRIVFSHNANWDFSQSFKFIESTLSTNNSDIVAIVSQNDSMALGAFKALEELNLHHRIFVYGVGGTKEALLSIKDKHLSGTVYQSISSQANLSIDTLLSILSNNTPPPEILVDEFFITPKNIELYLK